MKKSLISLLAILLAAGMIFVFAGCNNGKTDEPTTEEATVSTPITTEALTANATEADTEAAATTEPTTEAADSDAPPANLGTLSQEEQLAYFNKALSRVRTEKPGYTRTEQLKIADMNFTGIVRAVQGIINNIASDLMPGDLVTEKIAKGADNKTKFLSENANPSELRMQDINSIKSTKSGDNWIIEVRVKDATNPQKLLGSTVSRISAMSTREEILSSITDAGPITADPANASVLYHAVNASVTINAKGQVIEAANGFDVAADAKSVKISFIGTDAKFSQTSRWTYKNFNW